MFPLRK